MFVPGTKKALNTQTATYSLYTSRRRKRVVGKGGNDAEARVGFGLGKRLSSSEPLSSAQHDLSPPPPLSRGGEARREAGSQQQGQRRGIEKKHKCKNKRYREKGEIFLHVSPALGVELY